MIQTQILVDDFHEVHLCFAEINVSFFVIAHGRYVGMVISCLSVFVCLFIFFFFFAHHEASTDIQHELPDHPVTLPQDEMLTPPSRVVMHMLGRDLTRGIR